MASATGRMKILPSPIRPVRAVSSMAWTARSTRLSSDHQLDLHLGQEVDHVFGAPVELGVALLSSEALGLRHGQAPQSMSCNASLTSSSLNGLITASIFFIARPCGIARPARRATPLPGAIARLRRRRARRPVSGRKHAFTDPGSPRCGGRPPRYRPSPRRWRTARTLRPARRSWCVDDGDAALLEQPARELPALPAGAGDVGEGVEGAGGPAQRNPGNSSRRSQITSRRASKARRMVSTLSCGPSSAAMQACWGRRVGAGIGVDDELVDMGRERGGPDAVARAPAGHGIGLGPAVEQDRAVPKGVVGEQTLVAPTVEQQAGIDLVGEHRDAREALQPPGQGVELAVVDHAAGRVGGAC